MASDGVYNINVVNLDTQTVEETIPTSKRGAESLIRPWYKLQGGDDGNVYVQVYGSYIAPFSPNTVFHPQTHFAIARHTPGTAGWIVIEFPRTIVPRIPAGADISHSYLMAVDTQGNLYFSMSWSAESGNYFDLLKLNPQGEVIWNITEEDLANRRTFRELLDDDHFFITSGADLSTFGFIQVTPRA